MVCLECFKRLPSDFTCIIDFRATFLMKFTFYTAFITKKSQTFCVPHFSLQLLAFVYIHIIYILTLTKRFKEYLLFCRKQSRFRSVKGLLSSTMQEAEQFKFYRKPNRFSSTQSLLGSILKESDSFKFYRKPNRFHSTQSPLDSIFQKADQFCSGLNLVGA